MTEMILNPDAITVTAALTDDNIRAMVNRLIQAAGYSDWAEGVAAKGGVFQEEFVAIMGALVYIGARKVDDYGNFRMDDLRSWSRETWGAYWDIQRKFGRLENQLQQAAAPYSHSREDSKRTPCAECVRKRENYVTGLMETLGDQAVYCVRMIQILRRLEEKGWVR